MAEREVKKWITVNGVHVPIFEGQSVEDAVKKAFTKKSESGSKEESKSENTFENRKKLKQQIDDYKAKEITPKTHYYGKSELEDKQFRQNAIEEMKKYEKNWNSYSAKEKKNISPNGVKELRARIKEIEDYEKAETKKTALDNEDIKEKQIAQNKAQADNAEHNTRPSELEQYNKWIQEGKQRLEYLKDKPNSGKEIRDLQDDIRKWEDRAAKVRVENKKQADKANGTIFKKEYDDKVKTYQDKFLKNKTPEQINEIKKNLETSGNIVGYTEQDHIALAAIEKEMQIRKDVEALKNDPMAAAKWDHAHYRQVADALDAEVYRNSSPAERKELDRLRKIREENTRKTLQDTGSETFNEYADFFYQNTHMSKDEARKIAKQEWIKGTHKNAAVKKYTEADGSKIKSNIPVSKEAGDAHDQELVRVMSGLEKGSSEVTKNKEIAEQYKRNKNYTVTEYEGQYRISKKDKSDSPTEQEMRDLIKSKGHERFVKELSGETESGYKKALQYVYDQDTLSDKEFKEKYFGDKGSTQKQSLSKMNINQLRDLAVSLGADKKRLYGTSKEAMIVIINKLKKG